MAPFTSPCLLPKSSRSSSVKKFDWISLELHPDCKSILGNLSSAFHYSTGSNPREWVQWLSRPGYSSPSPPYMISVNEKASAECLDIRGTHSVLLFVGLRRPVTWACIVILHIYFVNTAGTEAKFSE